MINFNADLGGLGYNPIPSPRRKYPGPASHPPFSLSIHHLLGERGWQWKGEIGIAAKSNVINKWEESGTRVIAQGVANVTFVPRQGIDVGVLNARTLIAYPDVKLRVTLAHLNIQFGFPRVAFYFILFYFIFERRERRPRLDSDRFELQNVFAFGIERDNRWRRRAS